MVIVRGQAQTNDSMKANRMLVKCPFQDGRLLRCGLELSHYRSV